MDTGSLASVPPSPVPSQSSILSSEFFGYPHGDIILRTSDNIDFRSLKATLSFASPVFQKMFSLPQPPQEDPSTNAEPIPVVLVSESSSAIETLLRFCYPVKAPDLTQCKLSVILAILRAAIKYEIDIVTEAARLAFKDRVEENNELAIAGYALACYWKLEEEARIAAKATLKWPICRVVLPEFTLMSAMDYINLRDHHENAGEAIAELFQQITFNEYTCQIMHTSHNDCRSSVHTLQLKSHNGTEELVFVKWWTEWKSNILDALRRAPLGLEIFSTLILALYLRRTECNKCKNVAIEGWDEAKTAIIIAIKDKVQKVELKVIWK